jgi:hypothetical protein
MLCRDRSCVYLAVDEELKEINRYAPRAVGLMEIEHLIRYAPFAVGLKPSAMQGEARLRGLTHAVGLMEPVFALCRRAGVLGYTGQSPPARADACRRAEALG